jgi:hypothetical protein
MKSEISPEKARLNQKTNGLTRTHSDPEQDRSGSQFFLCVGKAVVKQNIA